MLAGLVGTLHEMKASEKRILFDAFENAAAQHTVSVIARQAGLPRAQTLYDFRNRGVLSRENAQKLAKWLNEKGYMSEGVKQMSQAKNPFTLVIDELRTLCEFLENENISTEDRIEKLSAFVAFYHTRMDSISVALKKTKK